jgi:hypothetical protein
MIVAKVQRPTSWNGCHIHRYYFGFLITISSLQVWVSCYNFQLQDLNFWHFTLISDIYGIFITFIGLAKHAPNFFIYNVMLMQPVFKVFAFAVNHLYYFCKNKILSRPDTFLAQRWCLYLELWYSNLQYPIWH